MSPEQNDILSLIAASIFADKRIYESEIEAFVKASSELQTVNAVSLSLSEVELLKWYEVNKDEISQKVSAPYFKDWFYELLTRLSGVQDKQPILDAMQKISIADGSVHVRERALMTLAKSFWEKD